MAKRHGGFILMSRHTEAYSSFVERLGEIDLLIALARKKERNDAVLHRKEINAFCRGAVVLLSSHVEAYVKELGECALERFYQRRVDRSGMSSRIFFNISKEFVADIKDTADPEKIAEKIFLFIESDLTFWAKHGAYSLQIPVEKFNKGFSNPAFDKIKSYFSRFGYEDYRRDFYRDLGINAQTTQNMLDGMVALRNNIAHGDVSATRTPREISEMTDIIKNFCRCTDSIFSRWCKLHHCPIR
ncbi:MAE_28990/MAE_18760 family HEPN-like nuclease [Rhizobium ruizarguesonis]|uniref:MAE_28990/MAE_18760 family HEPN-like nuclease n=1 Tax=Rhizobium ruizarguesonis TaxID=2081791 RepID=UPI001030C53C|nr:MAE_28990/MAE_18760 family HEPN-like nuclease [Rhizobium ruizarguesonis]TAT84359.1 hypothetical protein ELI52_13120 [Rhizobium ruizarguesonis]